jgi:hypothetical protein
MRAILILLIAAAALCGQMKTEAAGAPPAEAGPLAGALAKEGVKVLKEDGSVLCEMWLAAAEPSGGSAEQNATWAAAPQGVLLGVARFPARHADRRGQQIKPGVYTLRYGLFPMNGDHQGVEPQRDFLVLSPAAADTDASAKPSFDALMNMSRKASGTPHPLVLSFWKEETALPTGVEAVGESDQVLHAQIGKATVSIIVVGKTAH